MSASEADPGLWVTGLVDVSDYGASVAEHAAWLAEHIGARLRLRHVREPGEAVEAGQRLLSELSSRLADQGLPPPQQSLVEGEVLDAAVATDANLLVMGKRGAGGQQDRTVLGHHVDSVVRAVRVPVCLTAQVFLPIHRVVAVTDANPTRRAALDLVAAHATRAGLELDVIVAAGVGEPPDDKLTLARSLLDGQAAASVLVC